MHRNIHKVALNKKLDIDKFAAFCKENYDKFHLCGSWINAQYEDDLVKAYCKSL